MCDKTYVKSFSTHCRACDRILQVRSNSPLPDGSYDDLCQFCKVATKASNFVRYKDYAHIGVTGDSSLDSITLDDFTFE